MNEVLQGYGILRLRIVFFALCTGCLVFLAFVWIKRWPLGEPLIAAPGGGMPMLSLMALVAFPSSLIGVFIVRRSQATQAAKMVADGDPSAFEKAYFTQLILCLGILEGSAFFALCAYLIEGGLLPLLLALLVAVALALQFPTQRKLDDWADRLKRRAREDASFR